MRDPALALPDLAPPPGGLLRLRNSVEAGRRRRPPLGAVFAAAACVTLMVALAVLPGVLQRQRSRAVLARAVREAVQPSRTGELRVTDGAALALDSGQPGVRLYLVQSTRAGGASPDR